MEIGLLGDLGAQRVDDHELAAGALRLANAPNEMKVGDRGVVAPDDVEFGVLCELRRASGYGAVGAGPGFAAHTPAERMPVELRGAQPVEKPRRHAVPSEETMRAGIVERHHRLWPPALYCFGHPRMDLVQRGVPRNALESRGSLRPDPPHRMQKALRPMDEVSHVTSDFVADNPGCVGERIRTAHLDDPTFVDDDTQAAGIGTIEGADARAYIHGHANSPRPVQTGAPFT